MQPIDAAACGQSLVPGAFIRESRVEGRPGHACWPTGICCAGHPAPGFRAQRLTEGWHVILRRIWQAPEGVRGVAAGGGGGGRAGAGRGSGAVRRGNCGVAARPTGPVLAFSPSPYDYGQVSRGQSASQTFILSNSGQKTTGRLRVRLSGPAAFSITRDTCRKARLRPGGACAITVRLAPSRAGRITATLTAASKGGPQHAATAADVLTGGRVLGAAPGQIYWVSQDEIWAAAWMAPARTPSSPARPPRRG